MFHDKATNTKKTKVDDATYKDDNFINALNGSNIVVVEKAPVGFGIDFSESDPGKQDIMINRIYKKVA